MWQAVSLFLVLVMWLQAPTTDKPAADKITVSPISVTETRHRSVVKEKQPFGPQSGTELLVHVQGPAVDGATGYGQLKLTAAADDAGTDMKPRETGMSMGNDGFEQIRSGMLGMLQKEDEKGFRIKIDLGPAARKAAKIKLVKGEFQVLAGGKEATVTAKGLPGMLGKSLEDPQLKQAGVQIKLVDPKKGGGGMPGGGDNTLSLQIAGNISVVQQIEVLDQAGKDVTQGSMSGGTDKQQERSYQLSQPVDDAMTLKVKLVIGQKKVKVPFELKDIELP